MVCLSLLAIQSVTRKAYVSGLISCNSFVWVERCQQPQAGRGAFGLVFSPPSHLAPTQRGGHGTGAVMLVRAAGTAPCHA